MIRTLSTGSGSKGACADPPVRNAANIFSAAAMLTLQYKGHAPESLE
jgi:hypothetical protein